MPALALGYPAHRRHTRDVGQVELHADDTAAGTVERRRVETLEEPAARERPGFGRALAVMKYNGSGCSW